MIIILTDGSPNELDQALTYDDVINYNKYLVQKVKGHKIGIFGLLISDKEELSDRMSQIFGSDFAQCEDIDQASDKIIKLFSKTVKDFISRSA